MEEPKSLDNLFKEKLFRIGEAEQRIDYLWKVVCQRTGAGEALLMLAISTLAAVWFAAISIANLRDPRNIAHSMAIRHHVFLPQPLGIKTACKPPSTITVCSFSMSTSCALLLFLWSVLAK